MYFDEVFEFVGGAGAYQVCLLCYVFALSMLGIEMGGINFVGGYMEHWCNIPALENFTHEQQQYIAIPSSNPHPESDLKYENCYKFPLDFNNYSLEDLHYWNRTERIANIPEEKWLHCDNGWVYDQSDWISTINSEVIGFSY